MLPARALYQPNKPTLSVREFSQESQSVEMGNKLSTFLPDFASGSAQIRREDCGHSSVRQSSCASVTFTAMKSRATGDLCSLRLPRPLPFTLLMLCYSPAAVLLASAALANPAAPGPLTHPAGPGMMPPESTPQQVRPTAPLPAPVPPPAPAPTPAPSFPISIVQPAWLAAESPYLSGQVQLTFPSQFSKAGEGYFQPAQGGPSMWIIFQAVPAGSEETNYQMYVAKLERNAAGEIVGLDKQQPVIRLSGERSSSTCGWFHPTQPGRVIFGSTVIEPKDETAPGFSRDAQRYTWKFPPEMRIVSRTVPELVAGKAERIAAGRAGDVAKAQDFVKLPNGAGYAAECSISPDGRFVLFTYRDPKTQNPDIWVTDTKLATSKALVTAKGYNGGPFFSPDGKQICYRSDRKGDSNLQLFVADLAIDAGTGEITGIIAERQLTDDANVNWTPFYHPSGEYLVFASSRAGHRNYEVFAIDPRGSKPASERGWGRITDCAGFDGLPVFNQAGTEFMWTSQRGPVAAGEQRPSSQLWVARVTGSPAMSIRSEVKLDQQAPERPVAK